MGVIKKAILFIDPYHGRKHMVKCVVCPNCRKALMWPYDQESGDCIYCGYHFMIGYPLRRVTDEF